MATFEQQINEMDCGQLDDLTELINKRRSIIESDNYKQELVPEIFMNLISNISFNTNFGGDEPDFDSYKQLESYGLITFSNQVKISTEYAINYRNDWNDRNVNIKLKINKHNIKINYSYEHEWIRNSKKDKCKKEITLKLDKLLLKILDAGNLEQNPNNQLMLALLINNIIQQTKLECDSNRDYNEKIIGQEDINAIENNYLIYNNNNTYFKCEYMDYKKID